MGVDQGQGIAMGIHSHDPAGEDWRNDVEHFSSICDCFVIVEWAWRDRGLIVAPGNPHGIARLADLAGKRIALQPAAGKTSRNLEARLLAKAKLGAGQFTPVEISGHDAESALVVSEGRADAAFGLASLAAQYRLNFVPLLRERFDLLVRREEWFDEPFQRLIAFTSGRAFRERASTYPDYDFSGIWRVHFNQRAHKI